MYFVLAFRLGVVGLSALVMCGCSVPSMVPRLGVTAFVGRRQVARQLSGTTRGGDADDASVSLVAAWEEMPPVVVDPSVPEPAAPDIDAPPCSSDALCAWADAEIAQASMELEP